MHIYPAKSSRFESSDFASVMIDDVGCSGCSVPGVEFETVVCKFQLFCFRLHEIN